RGAAGPLPRCRITGSRHRRKPPNRSLPTCAHRAAPLTRARREDPEPVAGAMPLSRQGMSDAFGELLRGRVWARPEDLALADPSEPCCPGKPPAAEGVSRCGTTPIARSTLTPCHGPATVNPIPGASWVERVG